MSDLLKLKAQRDRFLAFAMAAADILVEVDRDSRTLSTFGATQTLLQGESAGEPFVDLFVEQDRPLVARLLAKAWESGRIEPVVVRLRQANGSAIRVNIGACHFPDGQTLFITLTLLSALLARLVPQIDPVTSLLSLEEFRDLASVVVGQAADEAASPKAMQLIDLPGLANALEGLPATKSAQVLAEVGAVLRANALSGNLAGQLGPDQFAVVTSGTTRADDVQQRLDVSVSDALKMAGTKKNVTSRVVNIQIDAGDLTPESAFKAISYALQSFATGNEADLKRFQSGLSAALEATVGRYSHTRDLITQRQFELHFQPVEDLQTRTVHHFEALVRFDNGQSAYETVRFSEEIGLVQELDLATIDQAIRVLEGRSDISLAVNISGASIENDGFRHALMSRLASERALSERLLFEITESSQITDLDTAATFLGGVRRRGFNLCLDDFGAGAAGYNYLRALEVDYVKIDGNFLQAAVRNERQRALIHSIKVLCDDLGASIIGEMIETEEILQLAKSMGLRYGQGYLLGKPLKVIPPRAMAPPARRQGYKETWG
ncbi:hypothetical protein AEAC466_17910 [Asticcacaulis sp. AC466]|uniref:EAL domain-containing protein n=1 Tax=Asticcacaulis sp. AC466 TaxID=1282362 RepID=UPI0003C3EB6B|nr:EAL domain-containing protein [Asticcacaulis sp. AC466]ESQ82221.1 hypothetical protein AEAC466_17910 [Asticcacaulis sp. AC466]